MTHHRFSGSVLLLLAGVTYSPAFGQDYPSRTVQIFVGTTAGGAVDVMARGLAEDLAKSVGGTFIVINKEGRNNTLAATQVARSNADGYTLGFNAAGPFVSDLHTREGIPFKVEQIDFLCQLVELPVAFAVAANSKYKSLPELLRAAKSAPQTINVGSVGAGSVPTLVLGLLERQAGVKFNNIHYKGDGELVTALLGGHIDAAVPGVSTVAGKGLPVLATSSEHRVPNLQDVPTLKELGYPIVKVGMAGLYAPAGMPPEVRSRLVKACSEIASNGEKFKAVAARLKQQISFLGPDRWKQRIAEDSEENKPIIKQLESAH